MRISLLGDVGKSVKKEIKVNSGKGRVIQTKKAKVDPGKSGNIGKVKAGLGKGCDIKPETGRKDSKKGIR